MNNASAWIKKTGNQIILNHQAVQNYNARIYNKWGDLDTPLTAGDIRNNMHERLDSYRRKFENREIMFEDGSVPEPADFYRMEEEFTLAWPNDSTIPETKQYILVDNAMILCGPHDRHYIKTEGGEIRFSRNNCSLGRAQGRVEVLFVHANGMRFVRTPEMWGWLSPNAGLSPEIRTDAHHYIYVASHRGGQTTPPRIEEARWFTTKAVTIAGLTIPKGAFLAGNDRTIWLAKNAGFESVSPKHDAFPKGTLIDTHRSLTWNRWIETLFLFLDDPYGWGGHDGWRDCSRLMLDTARSFGIRLARNSGHQARKTSYYLNVEGMSPEDRLNTIENAAETGIVLLHFKGHIMAWLGRSSDGRAMVLHALSEYYEQCPEDETQQTLVHTDRVVVSDLSLGNGTARGSFLDRITHVAVITDMSAGQARASQHLQGWTPQEETLYSAFIERLFDYEDIGKSWNNLGDILRDREHNILYNALGMNEDDGLWLQPDCADLPYALRAYFAWKRGLPMGVRKCSRGTNARAPRCNPPDIHLNHAELAPAFQNYITQMTGFQVHSGNARTLNDDDATDYYPVALTRQSLRPGTTFTDPHGHILMIAHYAPDTADAPGALYSVDAQPDGTITRKRFWRGNFLFAPEITSVGAGFKAFRPILCTTRNASNDKVTSASCHQPTNRELNADSGFVPYSDEQLVATADEFYDRVEAAIHPRPLSIDDSIRELSEALYESALRRLENVRNGDDYIREHGPSQMIMPNGYAVFETTGPWEDFATPSRDMRLLIAMDAVLKFPDSILRNAERYGLSHAEAAQAAENARMLMAQRLDSQTIEYPNSDGQPVKVTMLDLIHRIDHFEMAYHPADCNELRWGAPENSDEIKTCSRRASESERQKMNSMRKWFHVRSRPPR